MRSNALRTSTVFTSSAGGGCEAGLGDSFASAPAVTTGSFGESGSSGRAAKRRRACRSSARSASGGTTEGASLSWFSGWGDPERSSEGEFVSSIVSD